MRANLHPARQRREAPDRSLGLIWVRTGDAAESVEVKAVHQKLRKAIEILLAVVPASRGCGGSCR